MEPNNTCEKCRCVDGDCYYKKESSQPLLVNHLDLFPVNPLDLLSGDALNLEYVDIEIPILNPRVNVNMEQELPSLENLDPLKEETIDLEKVMSDIENTANFNSIEESMLALNNPDIIFTKLQMAFETFKELTGRQMTYSEMREMMG